MYAWAGDAQGNTRVVSQRAWVHVEMHRNLVSFLCEICTFTVLHMYAKCMDIILRPLVMLSYGILVT